MLPDNYTFWEQHDFEQERALRKMPICCRCKDHIQQTEAVKLNGKWYCEDCEEYAWDEIRKEYIESTEE